MNLNDNRVSTLLDQTTMDGLKNALETINTALPFLQGLTPDERRSLQRIKVNNKQFVEDALLGMREMPELLPDYLPVTEMENDFGLYNQLGELSIKMMELALKLQDTRAIAGSEAYGHALLFYRLVKVARQSGVPGAENMYKNLKARFEGQGGNGPNSNNGADDLVDEGPFEEGPTDGDNIANDADVNPVDLDTDGDTKVN